MRLVGSVIGLLLVVIFSCVSVGVIIWFIVSKLDGLLVFSMM